MSQTSHQFSYSRAIFIGVIFALTVALLSLSLGASHLSLARQAEAVFSRPNSYTAARILWYIRIPRTAACLLAGAALAVSGAVIQSVLSNSLASPSILGVNSGAGLAVSLVCAFGLTGLAFTLASFVGAMAAVMLVVVVAQKTGASRTTVVLGGVAVSSFLNAATEAVCTFFDDASLGVSDFKVGGFSTVISSRLWPAGLAIVIAIAVLISLSNEIELLGLGDETAQSLGLPVKTLRFVLLALAALLAGVTVSFAGLLGFVGLIVPHIVRRMVGAQVKRVLPLCVLFGAGFVTLCDLIGRVAFAPYELPAVIFLSLLGGPIFILLLLKNKKKIH